MRENLVDKNTSGYSFPFFLDKGKFKGIAYEANTNITCHNPLCTCQDMEVTIRPNNAKTTSDPLYHFYINLENKAISSGLKKHITPESLEFARAFIKEMEPETWSTLQNYLFASKMYIHKHTNLKELEVEFDNDLIENHSMIAWHEIFPFAKQIIKEAKGSKYLFDDQYCLRSDCMCTHTALTIIKIENNEAANGTHPSCYFNYKKNKIYLLNGPINRDIREIITKHSPELKKEYRERHEILRKLYSDYRKRSGIANTEIDSNINQPGRNDPCPCGSGKKYKKCCMV